MSESASTQNTGTQTGLGTIKVTTNSAEVGYHISNSVAPGNYIVFGEDRRAVLVRNKNATSRDLWTYTASGKTYPGIDTLDEDPPYHVEVFDHSKDSPREWYVDAGENKSFRVR